MTIKEQAEKLEDECINLLAIASRTSVKEYVNDSSLIITEQLELVTGLLEENERLESDLATVRGDLMAIADGIMSDSVMALMMCGDLNRVADYEVMLVRAVTLCHKYQEGKR